ncbi:lysozyme inhibitor LprI family protein [Aerosakkonema funiforme]|uniref:lysozyme inhibitor LprI family protein n=1 Tax=Aerosakkonema funiforme TaxID=1246630 RepID=UPI0035B8F81C
MSKSLLPIVSLASVIGLLSIALSVVGAAPKTPDVRVAQQPNCNNPQTQSEMNACAGISYQNADRKLNQVYQQLLPKLPAARKQKLVAAQQAWIKFRDASCVFERSEVEGGTMAPTIYGNCLATVTEQRTKDLEGYLDALNNR